MTRSYAERETLIEQDDGSLDDMVLIRGKDYRERKRVYHSTRDCSHLNQDHTSEEGVHLVTRKKAQDNSSPPCSICVLDREPFANNQSEHLKSLLREAERRQKSDEENEDEDEDEDEGRGQSQ